MKTELVVNQDPALITQCGLLVNVRTFEAIQDKISVLEGIARGERAIEKGRTHAYYEAKQRLSRWLK